MSEMNKTETKGKTDNKYHIYDLTEPKERNTPNRINGFGRSVEHSLRKGVSNHSIPNSPESVNKKFSLPETDSEAEYSLPPDASNVKNKQKKGQCKALPFCIYIPNVCFNYI